MIGHYIAIGVRNAARHKLFSFINIAGLAIGLTAAILIGLYVRQELSFDTWLPASERIYRISLKTHIPGQPVRDAGAASAPLGSTLVDEVPGVQEQARIRTKGFTAIRVGDNRFSEVVNTVDANFFTMIRLPFVAGDPAKALAQPDGVVLTQRMALRYFGTEQAIGRTLFFDNATPRVVTGILRDLPYNTQFNGDVFVLFPPLRPGFQSGAAGDDNSNLWTTMDVSSYVRLAPGTDPATVAAAVPGVFKRHLPASFLSVVASVIHGSASDLISAELVPLQDVHLTKYAHGSGLKPAGSRVLVYGFAAIAVLLLAIAGINFTNLATAHATLRAREVALRKVVGASKRQLMVQFLVEAVLMALLALVFALAATEMLLPACGGFLGHPLSFNVLTDWPFTLTVLAVTIVTGLLGGLYPALVLSGFRPVEALHSAAAMPRGTGLMRTALVVFQFAISIGLGIAALVIFAQIRFAGQLDVGFDRDNIVALTIDGTGVEPVAAENMMRSLAALPGVSAAALSDMVPASGNAPMNVARLPGASGQVAVLTYSVSPEFAAVYGVRLSAGRFLSRDRGADLHHGHSLENGRNVLIDEAAALAFGYTPASAIGKSVDLIGGRVTIVGVVRNVLFSGAQAVQVAPTVFYDNPALSRHISVRVKAGMVPETLSGIDRVWQRFIPDKPPVRWFVDDSMNRLYADDERQGALMGLFVGVAIVIACLGLFGLAAFTVGRRTKEIGIRKVFGASKFAIVKLLLWQFSIPVLVANLIAWPAAWYYLRHWLDGFAYRIDLNPAFFVIPGAIALIIAWATVAGHALRVAQANPVDALRYE
jgi:putative ABC transport system permease protein